MYRGTGKKGQAISGTAAMLSNIKKQGGWEKVKEGMVNAAALAAAKAAVDEHIRLSNQPVPTAVRPDDSKPTRH
ncbi:hypothetical protein [Erwinia amylovora]|uniref:hypothetical protein n=1 Tax=Erwinia amylovora TaxID=552 RepID=UPI000C06BFB6|nr:hypothetical protein [Erwinia amylovora]